MDRVSITIVIDLDEAECRACPMPLEQSGACFAGSVILSGFADEAGAVVNDRCAKSVGDRVWG